MSTSSSEVNKAQVSSLKNAVIQELELARKEFKFDGMKDIDTWLSIIELVQDVVEILDRLAKESDFTLAEQELVIEQVFMYFISKKTSWVLKIPIVKGIVTRYIKKRVSVVAKAMALYITKIKEEDK